MDRSEADPGHTGAIPAIGTESVPAVGSQPPAEARPGWVDERRAELVQPGRYLLYEDSGKPVVYALSRETTRIGRSLSADLRFDDATVSRRHALVVNQEEGLRVLDDRSLNGIFVNGHRVEWSPLRDGDEIAIGRHRLFYLDSATVGSAEAVNPPAYAE
jgi:pSer/pThr/pTyr-binding forkhead associated (FHA) protein